MAEIWHKTGLDRQAIIDKAHENTLVESQSFGTTKGSMKLTLNNYTSI